MGSGEGTDDAAPLAPGLGTLRAVLIAASLVFAPLAASAWLFLRLPAAGTPIAELAWRPARLDQPELVVVEAGGTRAWVVFEPYVASRRRVLAACRIELATARALRCERLAELGADDSLSDLQHAVAVDTALVVGRTQRAGGPHVWRAMLVRAHHGVVAWDLPPPFPDPRGDRVEVIGVIPSRRGGGFEIHATIEAEDVVKVARMTVDPGGERSRWQTRELPLPAPALGRAIAVVRGDPAGVIAVSNAELVKFDGDRAQPLRIPGCASMASERCLQTASSARYSAVPTERTAWLDAAGRLVPYSALPGSPRQVDWATERFRLVEVLHEGGTSDPLFVHERRRGDSEPGYRIELRGPAGRNVSLWPTHRGDEQVLVAQAAGGEPVRIARAGYELDDWFAVPFAGGLLLLESGAGRVVNLDRQLRRSGGQAVSARAAALVRERLRADGAATTAYLMLLFAFPVMGLVGLAALRRSKRGAGRPSSGLVAVLVVYAFVGAVVLLQNYRYMFPP